MGTAAGQDTIDVPRRIQRSHTDILKALASTVGVDTSGPHYKYSDDPYLAPHSNLTKRSYALSKEAGRKAARWVREEHPKLFSHRPEDPFVQSFAPKTKYSVEEGKERKESKSGLTLPLPPPPVVDGALLSYLLARGGEVEDVITVYSTCKDKGIELEEEVLQSLLEFLCFYNGETQLDEDWVEERWFQQTSLTTRKTWRDNGLAEEVFASLKNKGPPAYCALIRGMAAYHQVDKAWQLYQECREKDLPLDTGTYNAIIGVAAFLRDAPELRWQLVKEILSALGDSGARPDLGTLNATLEALSHAAGWRQAREVSLQVLVEFGQLGIKPSLATYYHLLTIHCRERGARSQVLLDILDYCEGHLFTLQDTKDVFFFVTAMDVARNHLRSLEAARRIHAMLQHGDNHLLIGDSYKESVYYRHFFAVSCQTLPVDEFMGEVYSLLVPHVYTPEPGIMQEVIETMRVSGSLHHLPQLWTDVVLFDHSSRERIVALVISALAQHRPSADQEVLTHRLVAIAKDIWTRVQNQDPRRRNRVTWTGQMLGELMEVLVSCEDYSTSQELLKEAAEKPQTILGFLPEQSLSAFLTYAVAREDAETAVAIVLYAQEAGHMEAGQMALKLRSALPLTPQLRARVASALGGDLGFSPEPPSNLNPLGES